MSDEASVAAHEASFQMLEGDTLASVLQRYEEVAHHTHDLVASLPFP
jgi:hypothetical protein